MRPLRQRTAMRRSELSRPIRIALAHGVLRPGLSIFDFGCGRGDDVAALAQLGYSVGGWDPNYAPNAVRSAADVVNLGYVINVIEDPVERHRTLRDAWGLARKTLVVTARLSHERDDAHLLPMGDGWLTRHRTFQTFYDHGDLGDTLSGVLGSQAHAAALGTYFLFRDDHERQRFAVTRFRMPLHVPAARHPNDDFSLHRQLFDALTAFMSQRGRPPEASELPEANELKRAVGSLRRAVQIAITVNGQEWWVRITKVRTNDLLVHLALEAFSGRPKWSALPADLQLDVKALLHSYKQANEQADRLLLAVGDQGARELAIRASTVGKMTPSALYVHLSALADVPALLRLYEGCARQLTGEVAGNVIKLWKGDPAISYLDYPDFEIIDHPPLHRSVVVDLQQRRVRTQSYKDRKNRPILHRKEDLVPADHPQRNKWQALTEVEEKGGFYRQPSTIGTEDGWRAATISDHGDVRSDDSGSPK